MNVGILTMLAIAGVACAAEPEARKPWDGEPGYCRFPGTISPDGAYVLAWAPTGLSPQARATLKEWPADVQVGSDADNFLMDARHGRIITDIPEFDYFSGQGCHKNRGALYIAWSPDSRSALAICEQRWDDVDIAWIEPQAKRITSVLQPMTVAFTRVLRQREKERGDEMNIQFSEPALLPGGMLVVDGHAGHFKEGPYHHYRLTFRVRAAEKKVQLELLKARKIPEREERTGGIDFDPDLNLSYGKLRARLDDEGRAALKKEEEEWLKFRDSQPEAAREYLTQRRAVELRARLEK